MKRTIGTCYYPEHWPEDTWAKDAKRMVETGLTWVRIGEFAWSRLEPNPDELQFDWLDRAIDTLHSAGLKVVLGTPTATPPRWMLTKYPDMVAMDAQGQPRRFGSRRHYCFSHDEYRAEAVRITTLLAERYGKRVEAWQTDNEYGCHDTIISYSHAARSAFQDWLAKRYGSIDQLNVAWGNVFWSMEYRDFGEIGLPNLTVTEPNPAHIQAFRRFSSDQVVRFNHAQVEAIRAHSPAPIAHNYMGRITEFDHFKVGDDLEIASWDSYPLGFLEDRVGADADHQRRYARQGDPDFQAFHHDLYRAVGKGRWWIMEQQPGPVNWAPHNPAPLPGMVRLWSWEAFAHGAEAVCYFRWRQAPFAQEQMHAGLLRPDSAPAQGLHEAAQVADEIAHAPEVTPLQAEIALVFDYEADWAWSAQPHGQGLNYFDLVFAHYKALRRAGLSVDVIHPDRVQPHHRLILAPGLMFLPENRWTNWQNGSAHIHLGPRSGARDADFKLPEGLPPSADGLDITVSYVESLRADCPIPLQGGGSITGYREQLEGKAPILWQTDHGDAVLMQQGQTTYLGAWLDDEGLDRLVQTLCKEVGIETVILPEGVRRRRTGAEEFWFNHNAEPVQTPIGELPAAGVYRRAI